MRRIAHIQAPATDAQYVVLGNGPHVTISLRDYNLMRAIVNATERLVSGQHEKNHRTSDMDQRLVHLWQSDYEMLVRRVYLYNMPRRAKK